MTVVLQCNMSHQAYKLQHHAFVLLCRYVSPLNAALHSLRHPPQQPLLAQVHNVNSRAAIGYLRRVLCIVM